MKMFLLSVVAFVLLLIVWFSSTSRSNLKPTASEAVNVVVATTNSSNANSVQPSSPTNAANNKLTDKLADELPDVLSVTNLEQWKSLIKDLKFDKMLGDHWMTARFRAGAPPVLLRHNGQSIIYKAEAIDVMTLYHTTDISGVNIYSPKMNIDETRELGLKLCKMFGMDSNKFLAWCDSVGNNWLDAPLFVTGDFNTSVGDQTHQLIIRMTYNDKQPWYIIFDIDQKSAYLKLMGEPSH